MKNLIRGAASVATLAFLLTGAGAASASPDPGPDVRRALVPSDHQQSCSLGRIDTQLVRCDDLTGAGVRAPSHIPAVSAS